MAITVTLSSRGNITLPASIRREFGLSGNDQIIAETTSEGILLRPALTVPLEIYTEDRLAEFEKEEQALAKVIGQKKSQ